jgi:hypothetical protein
MLAAKLSEIRNYDEAVFSVDELFGRNPASAYTPLYPTQYLPGMWGGSQRFNCTHAEGPYIGSMGRN